MPQFDTLTFFSQLFWVLLSFCFLYITLSYYILPTIAITLKVRNIKLLSQENESVALQQNDSALLAAKPLAVVTNLFNSETKTISLTRDLIVAETLYFSDFERAVGIQLNRLIFQIFV